MQGGGVVYVAGENPEDVQPRFLVACHELRIKPESVPLHVIDRSFVLATRIDELLAVVESCNAVLVIVDTDQAVSLTAGAEENSNAERMAHAKQLRRLTRASSRPTVIDLCHPKARATRDELVPRGGSAFLNEVDGNIRLWLEGDTAEMFSDPNKFRGQQFALNFAKLLVHHDSVVDAKGRPIPVPYFRLIDDAEADQQRRHEWTDENRLLYVMDTSPLASIAEWARSCQWFTEDGETPRKDKVHRLLKKLEKEKPALVQHFRGGRWRLTEAGKKEAQRP
jgi:hypothetical protein